MLVLVVQEVLLEAALEMLCSQEVTEVTRQLLPVGLAQGPLLAVSVVVIMAVTLQPGEIQEAQKYMQEGGVARGVLAVLLPPGMALLVDSMVAVEVGQDQAVVPTLWGLVVQTEP